MHVTIPHRYLTGTLIHANRLCTLGGTGLDIIKKPHDVPQDPGACYHQTFRKGVGYGLNNEYFEFDMNTGENLGSRVQCKRHLKHIFDIHMPTVYNEKH